MTAVGVVAVVPALDARVELAVLLGPTGNLRAPAAVVGKTLVVGFNEEVYREALNV